MGGSGEQPGTSAGVEQAVSLALDAACGSGGQEPEREASGSSSTLWHDLPEHLLEVRAAFGALRGGAQEAPVCKCHSLRRIGASWLGG